MEEMKGKHCFMHYLTQGKNVFTLIYSVQQKIHTAEEEGEDWGKNNKTRIKNRKRELSIFV